MKTKSLVSKTVALVVTSILLAAGVAYAGDIRVVTSGAFTAAYLELVPEFERATRNKVETAFGASMGNAPDSIPVRLQRGEPLDVVILAGPALDDLITQGKVVPRQPRRPRPFEHWHGRSRGRSPTGYQLRRRVQTDAPRSSIDCVLRQCKRHLSFD
jgi:extracellular solute-binding protein